MASDDALALTPITAPPVLLPGQYSARFGRVFAYWVRRMMRRDFFAVRLASDNASLLADLAAHPAPLIGVANHSAWWDPLVFVILHTRLTPDRASTGPIEAEQWRRFGFMKKLGLFGLDPHDPRSAPLMVDHVLERFRDNPRTNLWITPQGQFVDPRERITIRPGVSMVAAAASAQGIDLRAISIAIEYTFWVDRRPELLLRLAPVSPPVHTSTTGWHRAFTRTMRDNQQALAALAVARDPSAFQTLLGGAEGRVNPFYDLWQRVRGRSGAIQPRAFARAASPPEGPKQGA